MSYPIVSCPSKMDNVEIDIDTQITLRDPHWFKNTGQRVYIRGKFREYLDGCGWTVRAGRRLFRQLLEQGEDPTALVQRLQSRCLSELPLVDVVSLHFLLARFKEVLY